MIDNIRFDHVDASLKCGQIFSSKIWKAFIIFIYVAMSIVFFGCIMYFVLAPLTVGEYSQDDLIGVICSFIFSVIFLVGAIVFHKYYNSKRRTVEKWLEDAVLLKAKTTSIGERLAVRNLIALTAAALEVSFKYEDRFYVRRSERNDKLVYLPVYKKYADKTITIAYSPKYDEVILIKPECVDKIG